MLAAPPACAKLAGAGGETERGREGEGRRTSAPVGGFSRRNNERKAALSHVAAAAANTAHRRCWPWRRQR